MQIRIKCVLVEFRFPYYGLEQLEATIEMGFKEQLTTVMEEWMNY